MAASSSKKYIKRAYSKDSLQTYTYNKDVATIFPNFSFQTVMSMVDEDPVARGALNHFVDKCMEGNMSIVDRKTLKYNADEELKLEEKYKFRHEILRSIFLLGKMYNNAFIEIVKNTNNSVKSLNILDSMNVDPITHPNGDPIKYKSKIPHPVLKAHAEWNTDEIVWFKFGDRRKGFAPVDMKALYENLLIKDYVKRYVGWLWKTGQYRLLYNFKNASSDDIKDFLAFNKRHDNNFQVPFPMKGEMETKLLRDMKEQESLVFFLKYLDRQTLTLLRTSPIDAGDPDASGRSNADVGTNSGSTHVISFKKAVEDTINFDFFPKINKENLLLKFGPVDRFAVKMVLENIQIMQSINMTDEVIDEYLKDSGMFFKSKLFKEPEQVNPMMGAENPRDKDMAPSRKGKSPGESNKKVGTGSQSTTKTSQIKKEK